MKHLKYIKFIINLLLYICIFNISLISYAFDNPWMTLKLSPDSTKKEQAVSFLDDFMSGLFNIGGGTCYKGTYTSGSLLEGVPTKCADGLVQRGAFCYEQCPDGYSMKGAGDCYRDCPAKGTAEDFNLNQTLKKAYPGSYQTLPNYKPYTPYSWTDMGLGCDNGGKHMVCDSNLYAPGLRPSCPKKGILARTPYAKGFHPSCSWYNWWKCIDQFFDPDYWSCPEGTRSPTASLLCYKECPENMSMEAVTGNCYTSCPPGTTDHGLLCHDDSYTVECDEELFSPGIMPHCVKKSILGRKPRQMTCSNGTEPNAMGMCFSECSRFGWDRQGSVGAIAAGAAVGAAWGGYATPIGAVGAVAGAATAAFAGSQACWQKCGSNSFYTTSCGDECAINEGACTGSLVNKIQAPIMAAVSIAVTVGTAGGGSAATAGAKQAVTTAASTASRLSLNGIKTAASSVLRTVFKGAGSASAQAATKAIAETAVQSTVKQVVKGIVKNLIRGSVSGLVGAGVNTACTISNKPLAQQDSRYSYICTFSSAIAGAATATSLGSVLNPRTFINSAGKQVTTRLPPVAAVVSNVFSAVAGAAVSLGCEQGLAEQIKNDPRLVLACSASRMLTDVVIDSSSNLLMDGYNDNLLNRNGFQKLRNLSSADIASSIKDAVLEEKYNILQGFAGLGLTLKDVLACTEMAKKKEIQESDVAVASFCANMGEIQANYLNTLNKQSVKANEKEALAMDVLVKEGWSKSNASFPAYSNYTAAYCSSNTRDLICKLLGLVIAVDKVNDFNDFVTKSDLNLLALNLEGLDDEYDSKGNITAYNYSLLPKMGVDLKTAVKCVKDPYEKQSQAVTGASGITGENNKNLTEIDKELQNIQTELNDLNVKLAALITDQEKTEVKKRISDLERQRKLRMITYNNIQSNLAPNDDCKLIAAVFYFDDLRKAIENKVENTGYQNTGGEPVLEFAKQNTYNLSMVDKIACLTMAESYSQTPLAPKITEEMCAQIIAGIKKPSVSNGEQKTSTVVDDLKLQEQQENEFLLRIQMQQANISVAELLMLDPRLQQIKQNVFDIFKSDKGFQKNENIAKEYSDSIMEMAAESTASTFVRQAMQEFYEDPLFWAASADPTGLVGIYTAYKGEVCPALYGPGTSNNAVIFSDNFNGFAPAPEEMIKWKNYKVGIAKLLTTYQEALDKDVSQDKIILKDTWQEQPADLASWVNNLPVAEQREMYKKKFIDGKSLDEWYWKLDKDKPKLYKYNFDLQKELAATEFDGYSYSQKDYNCKNDDIVKHHKFSLYQCKQACNLNSECTGIAYNGYICRLKKNPLKDCVQEPLTDQAPDNELEIKEKYTYSGSQIEDDKNKDKAVDCENDVNFNWLKGAVTSDQSINITGPEGIGFSFAGRGSLNYRATGQSLISYNLYKAKDCQTLCSTVSSCTGFTKDQNEGKSICDLKINLTNPICKTPSKLTTDYEKYEFGCFGNEISNTLVANLQACKDACTASKCTIDGKEQPTCCSGFNYSAYRDNSQGVCALKSSTSSNCNKINYGIDEKYKKYTGIDVPNPPGDFFYEKTDYMPIYYKKNPRLYNFYLKQPYQKTGVITLETKTAGCPGGFELAEKNTGLIFVVNKSEEELISAISELDPTKITELQNKPSLTTQDLQTYLSGKIFYMSAPDVTDSSGVAKQDVVYDIYKCINIENIKKRITDIKLPKQQDSAALVESTGPCAGGKMINGKCVIKDTAVPIGLTIDGEAFAPKDLDTVCTGCYENQSTGRCLIKNKSDAYCAILEFTGNKWSLDWLSCQNDKINQELKNLKSYNSIILESQVGACNSVTTCPAPGITIDSKCMSLNPNKIGLLADGIETMPGDFTATDCVGCYQIDGTTECLARNSVNASDCRVLRPNLGWVHPEGSCSTREVRNILQKIKNPNLKAIYKGCSEMTSVPPVTSPVTPPVAPETGVTPESNNLTLVNGKVKIGDYTTMCDWVGCLDESACVCSIIDSTPDVSRGCYEISPVLLSATSEIYQNYVGREFTGGCDVKADFTTPNGQQIGYMLGNDKYYKALDEYYILNLDPWNPVYDDYDKYTVGESEITGSDVRAPSEDNGYPSNNPDKYFISESPTSPTSSVAVDGTVNAVVCTRTAPAGVNRVINAVVCARTTPAAKPTSVDEPCKTGGTRIGGICLALDPDPKAVNILSEEVSILPKDEKFVTSCIGCYEGSDKIGYCVAVDSNQNCRVVTTKEVDWSQSNTCPDQISKMLEIIKDNNIKVVTAGCGISRGQVSTVTESSKTEPGVVKCEKPAILIGNKCMLATDNGLTADNVLFKPQGDISCTGCYPEGDMGYCIAKNTDSTLCYGRDFSSSSDSNWYEIPNCTTHQDRFTKMIINAGSGCNLTLQSRAAEPADAGLPAPAVVQGPIKCEEPGKLMGNKCIMASGSNLTADNALFKPSGKIVCAGCYPEGDMGYCIAKNADGTLCYGRDFSSSSDSNWYEIPNCTTHQDRFTKMIVSAGDCGLPTNSPNNTSPAPEPAALQCPEPSKPLGGKCIASDPSPYSNGILLDNKPFGPPIQAEDSLSCIGCYEENNIGYCAAKTRSNQCWKNDLSNLTWSLLDCNEFNINIQKITNGVYKGCIAN
ncbi:MAG: hypothetical protein KBD64_05045 [Gammaproteobacteria bacterium]|nr:hypothetical protein [Gammaproteobacteria bacterium]